MCPTKSRDHLPTVNMAGEYEITWVRRLVTEENPTERKILAAAKIWHSAILIQDKRSAMTMIVQYEALFFNPSILLPKVTEDRKLVWNNTAVVGWIPSVNNSEWNTFITIGVVNGSVLNKWFDWVPVFSNRQTGYTLFSVWDRAGMIPELRTQFESVRDSCCHRFTEDGLTAFHEVGADFRSMQSPLCRNYIVLIKDTFRPVTTVDQSNPHEWKKVIDYYEDANRLVHNVTGVARWIKDFIGMSVHYAFTTYLADSNLSTYRIVHLSTPYLAYLLQRMKLPWQKGGSLTECLVKGNTDMPEAAEQAVAVVV